MITPLDKVCMCIDILEESHDRDLSTINRNLCIIALKEIIDFTFSDIGVPDKYTETIDFIADSMLRALTIDERALMLTIFREALSETLDLYPEAY